MRTLDVAHSQDRQWAAFELNSRLQWEEEGKREEQEVEGKESTW